MPGLIPLVLKTSAEPRNRTSTSPQTSPTGKRIPISPQPSPTRDRMSMISQPSSSRDRKSSVFQPTWTHSRAASTGSAQVSRPKPMKRLSQVTPVLPVLPYTAADWRRTISEIKRQHTSRRYRICAARCCEILDNMKDKSKVEPVYLIYTHFYAATSLEMCARPLPSTSPYRNSLLNQARTHFNAAAELINSAEDSVVIKVRASSSASRLSSRASTCHSPAGSVSSRGWTPDTWLSSLTDSVCSLDDIATRTPPAASENGESQQAQQQRGGKKRVKKVSFSLPQGETCTPATFRPPSVIVRPDSPTLGFDGAYLHMGASLPELPPIPKPLLPSPPPPPQAAESETASDDAMGDSLDEDWFLAARVAHRYFADLSVLRGQLFTHAAELDRLLAAGAAPTGIPDALVERPESRTSIGEDLRSLDKQARIERLRKSGWRKRFDVRRYEELRESVLAELGA